MRAFLAASAFIFISLLAGNVYAAPAPDPINSDQAVARTLQEGSKLTLKDAKALEETLKKNPDNLEAHLTLTWFYLQEYTKTLQMDYLHGRETHAFWIIEHHPDFKSAVILVATQLTRDEGTPVMEKLERLWLQQVAAHKDNPLVLRNAGVEIMVYDRETAKDLLRKGQRLNPSDPMFAQFLAKSYELDSQDTTLTEDAKRAKAAKGYQLLASDYDTLPADYKLNQLKEMTKMAFAAGEYEKAQSHAEELLKQAAAKPKDAGYGDAIHIGNIILGRIALKGDHVEEAEDYLLKAGQTPGSPVLGSFGPNMSLAQDLLKRNDRKPVLKYFELCKVFWKNGGEQLRQWSAVVSQGYTPNFGSNLYY